MKAVFCCLLLALLKGTNGQTPVDQVVSSEFMVRSMADNYIHEHFHSFLPDMEYSYDSTMDSALASRNFDLICHLNGQNKYKNWYGEIAAKCEIDRDYVIANYSYWQAKFEAAVPEMTAMYDLAVSNFNAGGNCGDTDMQTFLMQLDSQVKAAQRYFNELNTIMSGAMLVPYNILYGLHVELDSIFNAVASNPTMDAVAAVKQAEFRHMTIDRLTVIDACEYARWYLVGCIYTKYSTGIDSLWKLLDNAYIRGDKDCTGL